MPFHPSTKKLEPCTKGSVTVEAALLLPFLMLMGLGATDMALALNHKMMLANAARAGMQYGMVHKPIDGDHSGIESAVQLALPQGSSASIDSSMFCTCLDQTEGANSTACVNVDTSEDTVCSDGSMRASYLKIVIKTEYDTLLNYPGVVPDGKISFAEELDIRLNGGE